MEILTTKDLQTETDYKNFRASIFPNQGAPIIILLLLYPLNMELKSSYTILQIGTEVKKKKTKP